MHRQEVGWGNAMGVQGCNLLKVALNKLKNLTYFVFTIILVW